MSSPLPEPDPHACGSGPFGLAALRRMGRFFLDYVPGGPRQVDRIIAAGCACGEAPLVPCAADECSGSHRDSLRCPRCWDAFVRGNFDLCCAVCSIAISREVVQGRFQTALELLQER